MRQMGTGQFCLIWDKNAPSLKISFDKFRQKWEIWGLSLNLSNTSLRIFLYSFFRLCKFVLVIRQAITSPPESPPSGPKSIMWSHVFIRSKLCSITIIVFPVSTSLCKMFTSLWTSAMWSPVVGSSKIYNVFPVALFDSSVASFTLCASPPDNVVDGCPKFYIS